MTDACVREAGVVGEDTWSTDIQVEAVVDLQGVGFRLSPGDHGLETELRPSENQDLFVCSEWAPREQPEAEIAALHADFLLNGSR
jgi:hypothetical protein